MANPYAPPRAAVQDVVDPRDAVEQADRGTRLGAAILDGIIFAGMVYVPLGVAAAIFIPMVAREGGDGNAGVALAGGLAFGFIGFIVWCWLTVKYVKSNGQSLAKKLLGIKVVRADGTPISLGRIFWLRNIVNAIIGIIPLYAIIDALFIFSESRQCLHDKLADTIVVKA